MVKKGSVLRKGFSLFLSLVLLFCASIAAAESAASESAVTESAVTESAASEQPILVEIRSLTVGEKASLSFANTGDQDLMLVSFRFRGWDAEGNLVNIFRDVEEGADLGASETIMLLDVTCLPFLQPGSTETEDLSNGYEAVRAARLEAAVQQFTLLDGTTHRIPESQLVWFSSEGGYPEGAANSFRYDYPDASVFKKSYTFSLGVTVARIYPEYEKFFDVSQSGYGIADVRRGLFANAGVQADDLLWALNGIPLDQDPYALEKAKALLADGEAMELDIQRDGEKITITLPPEVMLTRP